MIGRFVGKYRILEHLGRGGMGTVFRALDQTLEREVAIKVLNADVNDAETAQRFRTEAMTVASLNHAGIATIYEFFEHEGQWLMVMEFVRGETLERTVDRIGALPVPRAVDFCTQALAALAHAHRSGVVHRDLKPANLMIAETGTVKVMDFGIALLAGTERLTGAGLMMGTPAFMAPEQVLARTIDARADVYAMGVVFYYLLTAHLPFRGQTSMSMARSHLEDLPTPVAMVKSGLPEWVQSVIDRAIARDPANRFQTADEFSEALAIGMYGAPRAEAPAADGLGPGLSPVPGAAPASPSADAPAPVRSLGWLAGAALAMVVLAGGGLWWSGLLGPSSTATGGASGASAPAATPPAAAVTGGVAGGAATVGAPPDNGATASPTPDATPLATAAPALITFNDVKLLRVSGRQVQSVDVSLNFVTDQLTLTPDNGPALASLPYVQIARATYAHESDPPGDARLPLPPAGLNYPGVGRPARHWLVLQSRTKVVLLWLDSRGVRPVLDELKVRAPGRVVVREAGRGRQ